MTEAAQAVFLSYASQDAAAARQICDALRAAGIAVFLDQSELRGGDAWDQRIRREIQQCSLFIAVISQHTQERLEGYFRREWKLAVDRSHDMAEQKPFLLPVVVDGTTDPEAVVPDAFRAVQWTRLPGGVTPPAFIERLRQLLSPQRSSPGTAPVRVPAPGSAARRPWRSLGLPVVLLALLALGTLLYLSVGRFRQAPPAAVTASATTFSPPPHSIAVLPFVNMSGDKEQEYFSDGLTEEVLNSLASIGELQVAARTSAFSFKGTNTDIGTIARKLNVGAVLEGSVRRSGSTLRITTQLINATTGFHLWSQTYDRNVGDILKVETEIADAVANALKLRIVGDVAARVELGGTRNAAAFDAYLHAQKAMADAPERLSSTVQAVADYTEAIGLDPDYALALAGRSLALSNIAGRAETGDEMRSSYARAEADAQRAIALSPDLAEGHLALAVVFQSELDFARADAAYQRALALAPGSASISQYYGLFATAMGHTNIGIAAARRAVVLDPLNINAHVMLGIALQMARKNAESVVALEESLALSPRNPYTAGLRGLALYAMGRLQAARESCEPPGGATPAQEALALTYHKLGNHAAAENMLQRMQEDFGDSVAYQFVQIYAQWGESGKALDWLERAASLRDAGLLTLRVDQFLDPLRSEPRFEAVLRRLKFPPSDP